MNPLDDILGPGPQPAEPKPPEAAPPTPAQAAAPPEKQDPLSDLVQTSAAAAPPATAQPEQEPVKSWSELPGVAGRHAVQSALSTGEAIVHPFIHPVETYENVRDIGHGLLQKAGVVGGEEDKGKVDALMKYYADRYGGIEQLRNTMGNDPFGFATDAATLLTGGEGALARISGTAGKVAGTVGRTIEPLAVPRAIGRGLAPGLEESGELAKAGVITTPGQTLGGYAKTAEDLLTSAPVLGHWIQNARVRSIESFNKAVANQVLEPIGEKVSRGTAAGHDLINEVSDKLKDAYSKTAPNIPFLPDKQYRADLLQIQRNNSFNLSSDNVKRFNNLISKGLPMSGQYGVPFKDMESIVSKFMWDNLKSADSDSRALGRSAGDLLKAMRNNVSRADPTMAAELQKANQAWALYSRMNDAAYRGKDAVFTPGHLRAAVKANSLKGEYTKGDALLQGFAELAGRVLPSQVPTSGTAERAALMATVAGGGYFAPHLAAGIAGGLLPYTRAGMAATGALRRVPTGYLPRGTTYQLGKMDESQQEAYDRARRFFPP